MGVMGSMGIMGTNRTPVESSNIRAIGFDPQSNRLEVEFKNGGVYAYKDVPTTVHEGLMAADSKGRYLAAVIKPSYACEKIS